LAELLVATLIMTLVMTAAYTSLSSSVKLWRIGESDLRTYQDARTSVTLVSRELRNFLPGASHLFEGDDNAFEFYAVTSPLDVEERSDARPIWIKYRLKSDSSQPGKVLLREECIVEGPFPAAGARRTNIDLGRKRSFELAEGVLDFRMRYFWLPPAEKEQPEGPPPPVNPIVKKKLKSGEGMPQCIEIYLKLSDDHTEEGYTEFTTRLAFDGPTTRLKDDSLRREEAAL
jgi:hypothetical protein